MEAAADTGTVWLQDQTLWLTPSGQQSDLRTGATKLYVVPSGYTLTNLVAAGNWVGFALVDTSGKQGSHNLRILAIDTRESRIVAIVNQGRLPDGASLDIALSPSSLLYEIGQTSDNPTAVSESGLFSFAGSAVVPVALSNWGSLSWDGANFVVTTPSSVQTIDPVSRQVSPLTTPRPPIDQSTLASLTQSTHIPVVLPQDSPSVLPDQYPYLQYQALPTRYALSVYSNPTQLAPNAPATLSGATLIGSIRGAAGTPAAAVPGQLPQLLAPSDRVGESTPLTLIDGLHASLLTALGAGGGSDGYYVQWQRLGWLMTMGPYPTKQAAAAALPMINEIAQRYETVSPISGVGSGQLMMNVLTGGSSTAEWTANDTSYLASAPTETVTDWLASLETISVPK